MGERIKHTDVVTVSIPLGVVGILAFFSVGGLIVVGILPHFDFFYNISLGW